MAILQHPLVTAILGVLLAVVSVVLLVPTLAGDGARTDDGHEPEQLSPGDDRDVQRSRNLRRSHEPDHALPDVATSQHDATSQAPVAADVPSSAPPDDLDDPHASTGGGAGKGGGAGGDAVDQANEVDEEPGAGGDAGADAVDHGDDGGEGDEGPGPGGPSTPLPVGPSGMAPTPTPPPVFDLVAPKGVVLGEGGKAVASGDLAADVGCGGDCVTHATVSPGGKDARFRVKTDRPARISLIVNGVAKKDSGPTLTQDWKVTFDGLTPSTTYQVLLLAEDANGMVTQHAGSFDTQKRFVAVTFSDVHVRRITHKGAIEFHFGTTGSQWHHHLATSPQKVKAGDWVNFSNKTVLLEDAPQFLNLRVQGAEHLSKSEGSGYKFCPESIPNLYDGIKECYAVATAWLPSTTGIDVDALPVYDSKALPGPAHSFVLDSYAIGLEITAYIHLDVWHG